MAKRKRTDRALDSQSSKSLRRPKKQRRRASTDDAKKCRREEILYSAAKLFAARPFDQIAMIDLANLAGVAKGTLYLYFDTKEEVFLSLMQQSYGQWLDRFDAWIEGEAKWPKFASQLTALISQENRLLRLLAILHGSIEHNLPRAKALEFRGWLRSRFDSTGSRMVRKFAHLSEADVRLFLLQIHCATVGSSLMSNSDGSFGVDFRSIFEPLIASVCLALSQNPRRTTIGSPPKKSPRYKNSNQESSRPPLQ